MSTADRAPLAPGSAAPFDARVDGAARRHGLAAKWVKYPDDVLPAWVAEHDFKPPASVIEAYTAIADQAAFGYHYRADDLGTAYEPWARVRHDWHIDPELVTAHVDVLQGVTAALTALCDPDGAMVIPSPVYFPFWDLPPTTGRRCVRWPMRQGDHGWFLDLNDLEDLVRHDPDIQTLLLCHPHNPTGRVLGTDALAALVELAHTYDFTIVSDEIHGDLVYPGHEFRPLLTVPGAAERAVAVTSAAKTFSLSGLRCAISVCGDRGLHDRVQRAHPPLLLGHPGRGGVEATMAAWRTGGRWVDALVSYLQANRDHMLARLAAEAPAVRCHPPESTFLAWVDVSACDLGPDPAKALRGRAGVAFSEGHHFGPGGEQHLRVNFGTSRELLDAVLDRALPHLAGR